MKTLEVIMKTRYDITLIKRQKQQLSVRLPRGQQHINGRIGQRNAVSTTVDTVEYTDNAILSSNFALGCGH